MPRPASSPARSTSDSFSRRAGHSLRSPRSFCGAPRRMPGSVLAGAGESFFWPDRPLADGDIPRLWGHPLPVGGTLRVGGRDYCPRRRRMPLAGRTRTRPRGMSPTVLVLGMVGAGCRSRDRGGPGCAGDVTRVRRWAGVRSAQPYVKTCRSIGWTANPGPQRAAQVSAMRRRRRVTRGRPRP